MPALLLVLNQFSSKDTRWTFRQSSKFLAVNGRHLRTGRHSRAAAPDGAFSMTGVVSRFSANDLLRMRRQSVPVLGMGAFTSLVLGPRAEDHRL